MTFYALSSSSTVTARYLSRDISQTHKIEWISVEQARKGASAISSLLCYSSLISCYKCKYQWIVNIVALISWVDSKWWCLFFKWSVWTECSSVLFLLLTVFTHVDWLMCDWWMKTTTYNFWGKTCLGCSKLWVFLNIVIKKWIILGPTVIYILISCKMFIVYNFSVVTEGCSNS